VDTMEFAPPPPPVLNRHSSLNSMDLGIFSQFNPSLITLQINTDGAGEN
jgi:hypothetical protein